MAGARSSSIVLAGSAVEVGGLTDDRQYPGAVAISVAGGTGNSTMYLVDGGYNNDPQNNTGNAIPFPDALQEFNVESGVRSARFGMSTGATVNAVTRSGTNAFHGNVFDFVRDHHFNSIRYFERKENGGLGRDDGLKRNQFGGTFGGPIIKDKLFFFFGTQITKNHIVPLTNDAIVPTLEVRNGDFRRIMSAACRGGTARTLGAPFVNNQIDPALYHPISLQHHEHGADGRSGAGSGRLRPLPLRAAERQHRPAVRLARRLSALGATSGSSSATSLRTTSTRPHGTRTRPNLLETTGNGRGTRAYQHTISSGLDYVVTPAPVRVDALLVPAHGDLPGTRRGRANVDDAGREHLDLHHWQRQGPGLPARRPLELGVHGRVLRRHAVAVAGLRLDQGLAQHLVRRLVDAPAPER